MRELGASLGVSANALYRYVGDRDGLAVAIGAAAAEALGTALTASEGQGLDRLVDIAHRYVQFATERPHAFSAFAKAKPRPDHPRFAVWRAIWVEVRRTFDDVTPHAGDAAGFAFWALVHGRIELARGPAPLAAPTDGLPEAVAALVRGFAAGGAVPSPLPPGLRRN